MKHVCTMMITAGLLAAASPADAQPAPMPPPEERGADRTDRDEELARARQALAEAARRVAELSAHETDRFMRHFELNRVELPSVRLGILVGEATADGVQVAGVTDDGPAAKAGIETGDLLVEVNGVSVAGPVEPGAPAVRRVQTALADANAGDEVKVSLRRGGRMREVTVVAEAAPPVRAFAYRFGDTEGRFEMPEMPEMPRMPEAMAALEALRVRRPFSDYELVRVTPGLGSYFNTERGLLVVRVGEQNPLGLNDGDVILSVDGREPESPAHAARILRSYAPGETAKIEIMRQRRKRTLDVTIPRPQRVAVAGP